MNRHPGHFEAQRVCVYQNKKSADYGLGGTRNAMARAKVNERKEARRVLIADQKRIFEVNHLLMVLEYGVKVNPAIAAIPRCLVGKAKP